MLIQYNSYFDLQPACMFTTLSFGPGRHAFLDCLAPTLIIMCCRTRWSGIQPSRAPISFLTGLIAFMTLKRNTRASKDTLKRPLNRGNFPLAFLCFHNLMRHHANFPHGLLTRSLRVTSTFCNNLSSIPLGGPRRPEGVYPSSFDLSFRLSLSLFHGCDMETTTGQVPLRLLCLFICKSFDTSATILMCPNEKHAINRAWIFTVDNSTSKSWQLRSIN